MGHYRLGVMQGRLLPKYKGRYQAHPVAYWQDEFRLAAGLGLDLIEFILDFDDVEVNPLMSTSGLDAIRAVSRKTSVGVRTVCADYFMVAPFHKGTHASVSKSVQVLTTLVRNASSLGVTDIIIPCVDNSRLENENDLALFCKTVKPALALLEQHGINLSLETDLPPAPFNALLTRLGSPRIKVNYDTGNSASLGYDPAEELAAYGDKISDVHIKDRVKGGGSMVLGTGDTDFDRFFHALQKTRFSGPFIMQAFRDDEGVEIFKKQLAWLRPKLEDWSRERSAA
jgi:L-ribulose-5-phosphate 3-epimerase